MRAHSGEPPPFSSQVLDGRRVLIIQRHVYDVAVGFLMSFGKFVNTTDEVRISTPRRVY